MESLGKSLWPRSLLCCVLFFCSRLQSSLSGDCPADGRTWVPFEGKCYHFVHGDEDKIRSYTFERAESLCQGFELLSVQSLAENDFVTKYSPEVWRGVVNVWLGMYYDTNSDEMRWYHGNDPVPFANWEDGVPPSDIVALDTCVALHSNTGKWQKVSCLDDVENGVVCEARQKAEEVKQGPSALVTALVILSVIAIVGVSVVVWLLHQRQNLGSFISPAFECHSPFWATETDRSRLVEAEETYYVP